MDRRTIDGLRARSAREFRAAFSGLGLFEQLPILGPVEDDTTTLYIYDFIDAWGVDAAGVADALAQVDTPRALVRVNSPGGDVFDGIAIHSLLRSSSLDVEVMVDGLAASSASVIALGGDTRSIATGAQFMVHDPWAVSVGNAADMRAFAEILDQQGANIAGIYAARTGQGTAAEWRERMLAEGDGTWFMADEALGAGLATRLAEGAPDPEPAAPVVADMIASIPQGMEGDGERTADDVRRAFRVAQARRAVRQLHETERV